MKLSMGPVLVVDDDQVIRQAMSEVMQDHGYAVLCAPTAEQALQIMQENPDLKLVIADVVMPGMSGLSLIEAAGRDGRTKAIPVVLMTAVSSLPMLGGVPYLAKPFSLESLLALVRSLVHD